MSDPYVRCVWRKTADLVDETEIHPNTHSYIRIPYSNYMYVLNGNGMTMSITSDTIDTREGERERENAMLTICTSHLEYNSHAKQSN